MSEVGGDGDDQGLAAVVEAMARRLQHRSGGSTGPVRRHARVHALKQRDEHGEGDRDMEQPERPPGHQLARSSSEKQAA